jgi:hypothetical protein
MRIAQSDSGINAHFGFGGRHATNFSGKEGHAFMNLRMAATYAPRIPWPEAVDGKEHELEERHGPLKEGEPDLIERPRDLRAICAESIRPLPGK